MLQEKYNRSFGLVAFDSYADIPAVKRLSASVWQLAVRLRKNLEWVHSVRADSVDEAEAVDEFRRARFTRFSDGLLSLLNESGGRLTLSEQIAAYLFKWFGIRTDDYRHPREQYRRTTRIGKRQNFRSAGKLRHQTIYRMVFFRVAPL